MRALPTPRPSTDRAVPEVPQAGRLSPDDHDRSSETDVLEYTIDADDRITAVNAAWQAVAVHGTTDAPSVVGTSLWTHFSGPESRYLYGLLFQQVRASGQAVRVPYRCDAPDAERLWDLEIVPERHGALVVRSRMIDERSRASVALLAADGCRSPELVVMCSWCARIDVDGTFHHIQDAVVLRPMLCQSPVPTVSHGICADCMQGLIATLDGVATEERAA